LEQRIQSIQEKLKALACEIAILKSEAAENIITMGSLYKLRKLKAKKHRLSQKLNQLKQKLDGFEKRENSLCFGGKRLFKAQRHLEDNGFGSHSQWLQKWRKARANSWYFLGAAAESRGNQNCQYDIDKEEVRIRADTIKLSHIVIGGVRFSYGGEEIRAAQRGKQPVTCKICKTGRKYYMRISVSIPKPHEVTNKINGGIGLDYNKGFIQECEVSGDGNIIGYKRYALPDAGKDKAKSEAALRAAVKAIAEKARGAGRQVTIENLDFKKKKATVNKNVSRRKKYNAMINSFDYARYTEFLETACYKAGVYLCKINPYNTSKTGAAKYAKQKGLNAHQAASYVIGRKGLGFEM
jgi:IS605 OrfB family transposase